MRRPTWHHLAVPALLTLAAGALWTAYSPGATIDQITTAQHGPVTSICPTEGTS